MYGNEESVELLKGFHDFVTAEFGLSEKADVFGFSRGGLYAVNYAFKYPNDVSTLYLDAPVLNLWSWPAGLGDGDGDASCWNAVKAMYGVDEETVKTHTGNPILHASELISTEIPVILVAGDSDKTVPYSENGALLKKAYDDAGASAQNTRERVPEKPCNEVQNIAFFMTFGHVADFSRKQIVAF